jgi:peptide/nickel transport system permease protein
VARSAHSPAEGDVNATALSLERTEPRATTPEWRRYFRAYVRSASSVAGLVIVVLFVLVAAVGPWIVPYPEDARGAVHLERKLQAPSAAHWFGTDEVGRDVFTRVIYGARASLLAGVISVTIALTVGVPLGLIAGYLGGWWDQIVSFVANILLSFPVMVLFILILNYLGPSGFNIVIAVTFSSAPQIMRIVRGLALDVKSRDYIFAAQTRGESPLRIMVVELLPNVRGPLIVDACLRLGYTTVAITTLTFLGLGLQPPDPDWGLMIKEASSTALVWKFAYMLLIPALSVSSLILGFNLMADGLREMSMRD